MERSRRPGSCVSADDPRNEDDCSQDGRSKVVSFCGEVGELVTCRLSKLNDSATPST